MTFVLSIIAVLAFYAAGTIIIDWGTTHKSVTPKQIIGFIVATVVMVAALYYGLCV